MNISYIIGAGLIAFSGVAWFWMRLRTVDNLDSLGPVSQDCLNHHMLEASKRQDQR